MGMFDNLVAECELPAIGNTPRVFQTKDTPAQWLDTYKIDADGLLWHEVYDIEDRSDPKADGLKSMVGSMTRVNKRWVRESGFTGEIVFYTFADEKRQDGWLEYSAYITDGELVAMNLIRNEA
jgi:hypothetical protein